ncbi:MAG: cobalamin biosynthesis protein CobW [Rhodospirillales bacterium]|nr:cobalamin biosynthesis protein CobW [Rhodospirillales bacterium]
MKKIPATVITGFLGSGKTTLIRHLLQHANGRRIALIINEFGDLGVDKDIVQGCAIAGCNEEDVIELANGCICCTVADDFLPVMERLLDRTTPPDHIVIETSGLALPKPLIRAFNWPEIKTRVTVDGVIAVVDGPAFATGQFAPLESAVHAEQETSENPLEDLFEDQLHAADLVLLNKADALEPGEVEHLLAELTAKLRPGVHVVATRHGDIDVNVLLGLSASAEDDLDQRRSLHELEGDDHDHDEFESFIVDVPTQADPARLETMLIDLVERHAILRIKGFVEVQGKAARHVVQGVGVRFTRYFDRPWGADEDRQGRLIIIGQAGLDHAAIAAVLQTAQRESAA